MTDKTYFSKKLLDWDQNHNIRIMPWKGEKDPYKIWISEIILQQTRVEQGLKYYQRFISRFPTAASIARADENRVFKLWEGLGYYSRCKNIIHSARHITKVFKGEFPNTFEELLALKGIGHYTASAIASFAYNLPYAVIDGNVFRVLSRFFGINTPVDIAEGRNKFSKLAQELLDKKNPGVYNQAIMDFGAVICKPLPLCAVCPLKKRCKAYAEGLTQLLPVKAKSMVRRKRWIYYLVIELNNRFYIRKRTGRDIWENLYEFIPVETSRQMNLAGLLQTKAFKNVFRTFDYKLEKISKIYEQQLTHQSISGQFIHIRTAISLPLDGYRLMSHKQLARLPFPKLITTYLKD